MPFRRSRLIPSALLIGTFAPDFEYFLRLSPDDRFGHTPLGSLVMTLPLALGVLWLFHKFVKVPSTRLLPRSIQNRVANYRDTFRFGGPARFTLIVASVLVGIATHLAWDSFTHSGTWLYYHWAVLRQTIHLPTLGRIAAYKALQHASTAVGIAALSIWFALWYRKSEPVLRTPIAASSAQKIVVSLVVILLAAVGGTVRGIAAIGDSTGAAAGKRFAAELVVTGIALVWWQLVAFGILSSIREESSSERGS